MLSAEANRATLKACLSPTPLVALASVFIVYDTMFHTPSDPTSKTRKRTTPWTTDRTQDELATVLLFKLFL
jgi:uncharacterized membrane protein